MAKLIKITVYIKLLKIDNKNKKIDTTCISLLFFILLYLNLIFSCFFKHAVNNKFSMILKLSKVHAFLYLMNSNNVIIFIIFIIIYL